MQRFLDAQEHDYETALAEIIAGRKQSHWIWYIFPQIKGLGRSSMSAYYGLDGLEEARRYLADSVLGPRLRECCEALLRHDLPVREIMGGIDSLKLRSSMTLFDAVSPGDIFGAVLDKFYGGRRDKLTLDRL